MEVWEEKNVKRRVHVRMVNEDKLYILMQGGSKGFDYARGDGARTFPARRDE